MPLRFWKGVTIRVRVSRGRRVLARITTAVRLQDGTWYLFFERVDGAEKGSIRCSEGPDARVEIVSTVTGPRGGIDPAVRFWRNVRKTEGCWLWTGKRADGRYGMFKLGAKSMHPSRAVYILTHGPIVDASLQVCHRCDNPPCVRPDHLFLGTAKENMADAMAKGRLRGGVPKVTDEQRAEIRQRRMIGDSLTTLATEFRVSRAAIVKICR